MRKQSLLVILLLITIVAKAQIISGIIKSPDDAIVSYASVFDSLGQKVVYSGTDGLFSIPVYQTECLIRISHVSYAPLKLQLEVTRDTFLMVQLSEIEIPEVLVKGSSSKHQSQLGVNFMEKRMLENIPSFFGEPDLLKAMTTLPGISGGLDLYSGIFVRGGNRDQNLFLIEGARYYSTSHAGGYLSLFNPEIISHVDVFKGVAPARYGDAISSVVDIKLSEGDNSPKLNIDLGTLRSGFVFETKGNQKFHAFIAGRTSNIDLITGAAFRTFKDIKEVTDNVEFYRFGFWDIDGKISFKPSVRTKFSLSVHLGKDDNSSWLQGLRTREGIGNVLMNSINGDFIKNNNITFNFHHLFSSGILIKNTSWITHYDLTYLDQEEYFRDYKSIGSVLFQRNTFIHDLSSRSEVSVPVGEKHFLKGGFQISAFRVNPSTGKQINGINKTDSLFGQSDTKAFESAVFLDDAIHFNENTTLKIGLRSSWLGAGDTSYFFVEPRVQFNYELSEDWSIQFGGAMNCQPFHDLVQVYGIYEKESWILANKSIQPQTSQQISSGVFGKLPGTSIDLSCELYYKEMDHLLYLNPIGFDTKYILDYLYKGGKGKSYGSELHLQKNNGKFQWSLAYTLSWSKRKFETLNGGDWFNSDFDRRHDLNVGIHYFSSPKNIWNLNYIFQTGRPFTMPVAFVGHAGFYKDFYVVGDVNNSTMPDYRRLDLSYKRIGSVFWGRKFELTFSIMNVLARKNPYSVFVKDNKLFMKSMYHVIPSVNFKLYTLKPIK